MKKLLFTVTNDLTYDRRMQRICRTLANNGFQVQLIGRELPNSKRLEDEPYSQHRIPCNFTSGKLFYAEYNWRLYQYLSQQQADVVCAIDLDTIVPCFQVAKRKGWKTVYDAHEHFSEVPEVVDRPVVKNVWERVAQTYIPQADLAYTVGPELAKEMGARYQQTFEVIRNVPDRVDAVSEVSERKYLLYQGALNMGRGLEALLEAMVDIDMPLKIAGEGDLSAQLRQQAKTLGLQDKVAFLGFVKPEALPELTAGAYIGLNLLENKGKSYYYSLANKFFDYIQAGVPSINMNFPEYKRINETYEVSSLISSLRSDEIKAAINQLVTDVELYNQLVVNAKAASELFNWQKESEKLLTLYREI